MWFFATLLILLAAVWIFIQTPFGQNWIIRQVTNRLSSDLKTRISIKRVDFSLFNKMNLKGVIVEDRRKDTILSAGEVNVRITDWFFLKKNVELKYIGLKDAVIKMQREDSVWRHQFLIDYFSSPSSGKKKEGGIVLTLNEIELDNIRFRQQDAWLGKDMFIYLHSLKLKAREVDFAKRVIRLEDLNINSPLIALSNYKRKKPPAPPGKTVVNDTVAWNPLNWIVQADKLDIRNGTFKNDNYDAPHVTEGFDGRHIDFSAINTSLRNIRWEKDTITGGIELSTKEKSGFEVKKLTAKMKVTPREMAFNDLEILTPRSTIRRSFRMSFTDFSQMGDFINNVRMQADFADTYLDSDDIAFFAPSLKTWKKKINLRGRFNGTVADMAARDVLIQAGEHSMLSGDISMTGLPDINRTFIDFKANDFRTTYSDAAVWVPAIRQVSSPDLRKLQYLRFTGSFTGFIRDFVTYGTITTNLGTVKTDLNMKLPAGQQPVYSGIVSTDYFRLGEFIQEPLLGAISMDGSLKGSGFQEKRRIATLDGKVHFVDFNDYRYHNINLKGSLNKKEFDGLVSIDDKEVELTLNGLIDFNGQPPVFNFLADVKRANLKNLNLLDEDVAFSGRFNVNFTGSNIDNFLGDARITEASLTRNGVPLPFDSLIVSSYVANGKKTLQAHSNEFDARLSGDFSIRELPDAFKLFLNKYYPAYIKAPKHKLEKETFDFDITTGYIEEYIQLFDSTFTGFNNSHITGSLNTTNNTLTLDAEVPQFKYLQYNFDDVNLTANGTADSLSLFGRATNIRIGDSLNVPLALFRVNAHNDTSQVRIFTGANQGIDQARINATVMTYNNGVRIEFDPSNFVVNGKTWTIDENGELEFRNNVPANGRLLLKESNQEITIRTHPSEVGTWNDVSVELKKVNLGDIAPLLLPRNRLEGLASGNILVEDPTGNLRISSDDFTAESLRLDNDSLGDVKATVLYDGETKQLSIKGNTVNEQNSLAFDMKLFLESQESQRNNIISLKANTFELKYLERFLGTLFSDISGYITGNFDLKGPFDQLQVIGKGRLKDAGLRVKFTQCYYKIEDREIELKPTEINLDGIVLRDVVTGNPVYLTGGILHESFKNMFFDLTVGTRKPGTLDEENNLPIQLLNTTFNDNKQFYGKVKGMGSFSLSGHQSDMYMKIDAVASTTDSSFVTIPSTQSKASGMADFLVERKFGREMVDSNIGSGNSNIVYDVDVTANRMVTVRVVLDDLTGDEIEGNGSGTLNIHSGTSEPLSIRGKFDIEKGSYVYTFKSFFPKPFQIVKGGNSYISWNGDPMNAQIQFEAQYKADKVSFSPLATGLNLDQSIGNQRENVIVVANLTGQLFKPDFKFRLELEPNSNFSNNFAVTSALDQLEKNENEMVRQVTYLIVFNSFAPPESNQANTPGLGSALNEFTYSTISSISGLFFNEINRKLNSELSKVLKTDNVSVNFSGSVYNRNLLNQQSTNFNINQSNFNVNVPISMFKDRFILTLGSTLDVPLQSSIQQNVQFLPDVTAEWLINQTGTIRASFFYRQNLDYLTTSSSGAARNKRSGASISYRREFDNLGELLRGRKRAKKQQQTAPPVLPKDSVKAGEGVR